MENQAPVATEILAFLKNTGREKKSKRAKLLTGGRLKQMSEFDALNTLG